jgi:phosphoribosylaminoimidazole-succinocarboxamide synthase
LIGRGKVRDKFQLPNGDMLIVTTDRISVGDMVVGTVAGKGAVLNLISAFWFDATADILANHKVSIPHPNAVVARTAVTVLPVEIVLRRYMAASQSTTSVYYQYTNGARVIYGLTFPEGLKANQELPMGTLITPTTKSDIHDEPLTDEQAHSLVDAATAAGTWSRVKALALELFERASATFKNNGLILADTKIEFGLDADGQLMVIDELFTPDSSRLWLANSYEERLSQGRGPENFDKEKVRAYLY